MIKTMKAQYAQTLTGGQPLPMQWRDINKTAELQSKLVMQLNQLNSSLDSMVRTQPREECSQLVNIKKVFQEMQ